MKNFSVEYFVQLLANLAQDKLDLKDFVNWLDAAVDKVESDYLFVQTRCQETGYDEDSPQEIDFGLTALEHYRESLGLAEDYLQVGEIELLEQAAQLAVSVHQLFEAAAEQNQIVNEEPVMDFCC